MRFGCLRARSGDCQAGRQRGDEVNPAAPPRSLARSRRSQAVRKLLSSRETRACACSAVDLLRLNDRPLSLAIQRSEAQPSTPTSVSPPCLSPPLLCLLLELGKLHVGLSHDVEAVQLALSLDVAPPVGRLRPRRRLLERLVARLLRRAVGNVQVLACGAGTKSCCQRARDREGRGRER